MKSQLTIVLACLLGCALAGCGRSEQQSSQPAPAPADESAADAVTSAQDAGLQAEPEATGSSAACNAYTKKREKVTAGQYCVCSIGAHEVHDLHKAKHLQVGQTVTIGEIDWVTDVKLASANTVGMMRSDDETELKSLMNYRHKIVSTPEKTEIVTHMVRITPENDVANIGEGTKCDTTNTKNVLRISFCYEKNNKWDCDPRDGEHNGDTHVQN